MMSDATPPTKKPKGWHVESARQLRSSILEQWDAIALWWSNLMGRQGDYSRLNIILPAIEHFVAKCRGKTVLDAGCGEGFLSRFMAKSGANVVAIDISGQQLNHATRKGPSTVQFINDDVESLTKLGKLKFDCCFCVNMLMDTVAPAMALKSISTHLKSRGHLIAIIPHPVTFGPDGIGLQVWNAKLLNRNDGEMLYSICINGAPARTFYFYRSSDWYVKTAPKNLVLIEAKDIFNDAQTKPGIWRTIGSSPVFKLFHWRKGK